ncbi:hypothetical protein EV652_101570 [Kribbella steppae]|uniref:Excisionase family DNA binding protein n=1 Tax=Kribbella steppae TaxID=2512223 RepID=A0A4R2HZZ6_9ACTN|nr:hypothetical protein [Kribbella steppae]TCO35685.1 hypothetical protein EV652_101570 [Kribbella steppae]
MPGPSTDSRIYLLDADERQVVPGGPAVIGSDAVREELPPQVFRAVQHVIEAMRAGQAVKITPLRPELPIDEAADAIGIGRDDLRGYVAEGAIPFRSSEYVDWVRLADVIAWDNKRRQERSAALQELLDEEPWDEGDDEGRQS